MSTPPMARPSRDELEEEGQFQDAPITIDTDSDDANFSLAEDKSMGEDDENSPDTMDEDSDSGTKVKQEEVFELIQGLPRRSAPKRKYLPELSEEEEASEEDMFKIKKEKDYDSPEGKGKYLSYYLSHPIANLTH